MFKRQRWILLALCVLLTACSPVLGKQAESEPTPHETLQVHYIDVGQGDATLLHAPQFTILIDAARHDRRDVVPYLQSIGIKHINILVGTHPHADHIGQMEAVLQQFPVDEVWMSGDVHTSQVFDKVLDAVIESNARYVEPRAGEKYELGKAQITIVHPEQLTGNLNGGSIGLHIQYGELSFLFTGDAEKNQEKTMLESGLPLQAHIFQLGHHGSSTSNTAAFLQRVQPEIAIYSAGKNNQYGHPHREVLQLLKDNGIQVYGTDKHGTIIVETNGVDYKLQTSL